MAWFNLKPRKRPQELQVLQPRFLGEQDGPPERELKGHLAEVLRRDESVNTAYLARLAYEDESFAVALCLRSQFSPDRRLVEDVARIFASMFGGHEHLDIVFLSEAQEAELVMVCRPFFKR